MIFVLLGMLAAGCITPKETPAPTIAPTPAPTPKVTAPPTTPAPVKAVSLDKWKSEHETAKAVLKQLGATDGEIDKILPNDGTCAGCHAAIFDEWMKSKKSNSVVFSYIAFQSFTKDFQNKVNRTPNRLEYTLCFDCHTPTLKYAPDKVVEGLAPILLNEEKLGDLRGLRVGCTACHSQAVTGEVGTTYYGTIKDPKDAPHEAKYEAKMATSEFCKPCHTAYPTDKIPADIRTKMKLGKEVYCGVNYDSWKLAEVKDKKDCQHCHMKAKQDKAATDAPVRTIHAHNFPGPNAPEIFGEAVDLKLHLSKTAGKVNAAVHLKNMAQHVIPDGCILAANVVLHVTAKNEKGEQIFYTNKSWGVGSYDIDGKFTGAVWLINNYDRSKMFQPDKLYNESFEISIPSGTKEVHVTAEVKYHDVISKKTRKVDPVPENVNSMKKVMEKISVE